MRYFISIFATLIISLIGIKTEAKEVSYTTKRVPAEWETHEATWMQWPGYWYIYLGTILSTILSTHINSK